MKSGKRRTGRELAFQLLFQTDVGEIPLDEVIALSRIHSEAQPAAWEFAEELAKGAWEQREKADALISRYAQGWSIERMPHADRNILRLALYEMYFVEDIPPSVSINEAVELAKEYSTTESARFVNGILGNVSRLELT